MMDRTVSPGAALLRTSRFFSLPRPLPPPTSTNSRIGGFKSNTMTQPYPQHQSIVSPLSSREKGDWGFKRPFPLKSTLATSTPMIRVPRVDTVESVSDFASAADHSLSLEKFKELRVAFSLPRNVNRSNKNRDQWCKSVFEEDMDFTDFQPVRCDDKRWKFRGPWLARMSAGDFYQYLEKRVRPRRAQFRTLLRAKLAEEFTASHNMVALEHGRPPPPKTEPRHVTEEEMTEYLRYLRSDRVVLYDIISQLLDLAPLGPPTGLVETMWPRSRGGILDSPWGTHGPPPSHPSAGISYLRTGSYMENHPIYGPQAVRTPVVARVVYPRVSTFPAKLGVGGFVADTPSGDNEFNIVYGRGRMGARSVLKGITHLDTTTPGGAKAYVDPYTATVDPSGRVILQLQETLPEAQLIAKENKGLESIYHDGPSQEDVDEQEVESTASATSRWRMERVADEISGHVSGQVAPHEEVVGSSETYGLEPPAQDQP